MAKKPAEAAPLTADEVRKIAVLSRLHLSEADVEKMRANQRDLGTMKTYDIFGNERPIQGPVE